MFQDEFAKTAEEVGLDRGQWQALTRLEVGAIADDALRDGLAPFLVEGDSADAVLDRLVGDSLAQHSAHEYRLTDRGRERIKEVQDGTADDIRRRATEGLSEEEYDALLSMLERVATNLGWQPT